MKRARRRRIWRLTAHALRLGRRRFKEALEAKKEDEEKGLEEEEVEEGPKLTSKPRSKPKSKPKSSK